MRFIVNDDSGFRPIHIHLTLDNKSELVELWKRLNLSSANLDKMCKDGYSEYESKSRFSKLWNELNDILKDA